MRIRLAFVDYGGDGEMPNVVSAVDEYVEDNHGGRPEFYVDDVETAKRGGYQVREMFVTIPDSTVLAMFDPPTIEGVASAVE